MYMYMYMHPGSQYIEEMNVLIIVQIHRGQDPWPEKHYIMGQRRERINAVMKELTLQNTRKYQTCIANTKVE
jgi:hypothetical protein